MKHWTCTHRYCRCGCQLGERLGVRMGVRGRVGMPEIVRERMLLLCIHASHTHILICVGCGALCPPPLALYICQLLADWMSPGEKGGRG